MDARQLHMFSNRRQPRSGKPEEKQTYEAVTTLRRLLGSHAVYRRGRLHSVAGKLMTTREMQKFCQIMAANQEGSDDH